jgi:hypothetical protein
MKRCTSTKFCTVRDHGYAYKFYLSHFFCDQAFEYGDNSKF